MNSDVQLGRFALVLAGVLSIWAIPDRAQSKQERDVWHVANNGVDSTGCGDRRDPCRSISQAMTNAAPGDVILVGPGRYGDLNGDGSLGGVGEESGGCVAVICVNKRLHIVSLVGAAGTVLDSGGRSGAVVDILASDVVFGVPFSGFTLTGSSNNGLAVDAAQNVSVMGNVASGNVAAGFAVSSGTHHRIIGNVGLGGGNAFVIFGSGDEVSDNVAQSAGVGYWLRGSAHLFKDNAALSNGIGFLVEGTGHRLIRNSVIGNTVAGFNALQGAADLTIRESNIYGNGIQQPPFNCGIESGSGTVIVATDNFWGAASGPGPDPADQTCLFGPTRALTSPFAVRPFRIRIGGAPFVDVD